MKLSTTCVRAYVMKIAISREKDVCICFPLFNGFLVKIELRNLPTVVFGMYSLYLLNYCVEFIPSLLLNTCYHYGFLF